MRKSTSFTVECDRWAELFCAILQMIVWGIISTATAGCKSAGGLFTVRFFLGFVEAAYFPGCEYRLSDSSGNKTESD